jgi:hypothetical protein
MQINNWYGNIPLRYFSLFFSGMDGNILSLKHIYSTEVGVIVYIQATIIHLKPEEEIEETMEGVVRDTGGQKCFVALMFRRQCYLVLLVEVCERVKRWEVRQK